MSKINKKKQSKVLELTISVLKEMLTFSTKVNIQKYIVNQNTIDYVSFEMNVAEDASGQSIMGTGVLAKRDEITKNAPSHEQDFLYKEVPLSSNELGAYIDGFPFSAVSASYLFTLLEVFGDDIAKLVNLASPKKNSAWHRGIYGLADMRDSIQVKKAQEGFGKHFGFTADKVPILAASRMVSLKRIRNDFAHDGNIQVDFENYLHDTLAVVCHIAFLTTDEKEISVYPWEPNLWQEHLETFIR